MNKLQVIEHITKLSKLKCDINFDLCSDNVEYHFNKCQEDWCIVKIGRYYDTQEGWIRYKTKDVFKHYKLSSVEIFLILQLFK